MLISRNDKKTVRIKSARREKDEKIKRKEEDEQQEKLYAESDAKDAYFKWMERKVTINSPLFTWLTVYTLRARDTQAYLGIICLNLPA